MSECTKSNLIFRHFSWGQDPPFMTSQIASSTFQKSLNSNSCLVFGSVWSDIIFGGSSELERFFMERGGILLIQFSMFCIHLCCLCLRRSVCYLTFGLQTITFYIPLIRYICSVGVSSGWMNPIGFDITWTEVKVIVNIKLSGFQTETLVMWILVCSFLC